jgi:hypothetical protein
MALYKFYLESCEVMDTRSFHEDTIVAGIGVIVNRQVVGTPMAAPLGNHNNGKFTFWTKGLGSIDRVEIGEDEQFAFIFQLYNNGQAGKPTVSDVQAHIALDLLAAADELASAVQTRSAQDDLAKLEAEIQSLQAQIHTAEAARSVDLNKRADVATPKRPGIVNPHAFVVSSPREHEALAHRLKGLVARQQQLLAEIGAMKQKAQSFSVLMPGSDWRNDGPFVSSDYSIKNFSRGKLISIVGNFILAGCDGPLALGFVAGSGGELNKRIPSVGPLRLSGQFRGIDLGWGAPCNHAGSHYVVNTHIQRD